MNDLEKKFKALANRRRLAILSYLKKHKEASVAEIADVIKLSFKATSKHLNILNAVGIAEKDQRSLYVFYCLNPNLESRLRKIIKLI
jgi:DNA-binding transcriptional ArsR family regulator